MTADEEIAEAIRSGQSFLVDAGAGSGKTSSLVKALTGLRSSRRLTLLGRRQRVACITYTNVAKDEILERLEHDAIFHVSTIHDFLWGIIKPFQGELKAALVEYNEELPTTSRRKRDSVELRMALGEVGRVIYTDRGSNFLEGRIYHDDLIGIAGAMFRLNPLLSALVGARFPLILVDEYQDTSPLVVEILLDRVRKSAPHVVVGFFGDKAQAIYEKVVGAIGEPYASELRRIPKGENYRCAVAVIEVLNRLRTDIRQFPAGDNVQGAAIYVGLSDRSDDGVEKGYKIACGHLADPTPFERVKVLYLTHRLIARKAGYADLFDAYREYGGHTLEEFEKGEDPVARFLAYEVDALARAWADGDGEGRLRYFAGMGLCCRALRRSGW